MWIKSIVIVSKDRKRIFFDQIDPDTINLINQQLDGSKIKMIVNKPIVLAMKRWKFASYLPILLLPFYFFWGFLLGFLTDLDWIDSDTSLILRFAILPLILIIQLLSFFLTKKNLYQIEIQFKPNIMDITMHATQSFKCFSTIFADRCKQTRFY